MQTNEDVKAEVSKVLNGEDTTPPVAETPVATPEVVKTEAAENIPVQTPVTPEANKVVDPAKLQEQVSNLNVALKEERDSKRQDKEKIAELEKSLAEVTESMGTLNRIKEVFAPQEQPVVEQPPSYLTQEQVEQFWQQKEQERVAELAKIQQTEAIKSEISSLEKTWDGTNGKPKYDDQEVLNWQQANNKLYLSPTEAFTAMKRNEMLDWEVNQRLSGQKPATEVERPGAVAVEHQPTEKALKTDQEVKQAVMEAMDSLDRGI